MEEPKYKVIRVHHYTDTYSGQKETKDDCIMRLEKEISIYIEKGYIPSGDITESNEEHKYSDVIKYYSTFSQAVYKPLDKQS